MNVELARAAGARLIFEAVETREQLDAAVAEHADEPARPAAGDRTPSRVAVRRPSAPSASSMPRRSSTEQCDDAGISHPGRSWWPPAPAAPRPDWWPVRSGLGLPWRVVGAGVSRPAPDVAGQILRLVARVRCGPVSGRPAADDVDVRDCRGAGFGVASDQDRVSSRPGPRA